MSKKKQSSDVYSKVPISGFYSAIVFTIAVIFSGITATAAWKIPSLITGIIFFRSSRH